MIAAGAEALARLDCQSLNRGRLGELHLTQSRARRRGIAPGTSSSCDRCCIIRAAMSRRIRMTFPKATIKAIMQMDDEVGKMSAEVPLMVSRCVELFLEELVKAASAVAAERSCNIVQPGHLKQCVANSSMFDFLRPLLEHVPDLGPAQEKKPKAQRLVTRRRTCHCLLIHSLSGLGNRNQRPQSRNPRK